MNWSVAEAKAHLSEVLRRARAGEPQIVGAHDPCVVVSRREYEAWTKRNASQNLGSWLVDAAAKIGGDIELPPRADRSCEFHED